MTNFYDTVLRNSNAFRRDDVCKDPAMLEPGTRAAVMALMGEAKAEGIDLRLLETYRSQTRQSYLFMKGATQLRTVGCHGYGVAADFGVFTNGRYEEGNKPYVFLRALARKHGLISGQDWGHAKEGRFVDSGHVQRIPVWRQDELFGGSWYPPENYDPYADSISHGHADVVILEEAKPDPVLARAQEALNAWAPSFALHVTGIMDDRTRYALRRYQELHGMLPTGTLSAEVAQHLKI